MYFFVVWSHRLCPGRSSWSVSGLHSVDGLWVVWTPDRPCVKTCVWGHQGPPRKINNNLNKTEPTRETIKRLPEKVRRWSRDTDILGFISVSTVVFSVTIPLIGVTPRSILASCIYLQQQHLSGSAKTKQSGFNNVDLLIFSQWWLLLTSIKATVPSSFHLPLQNSKEMKCYVVTAT